MKYSPWLWLLFVLLCSIRACYLYWSSTRELRGMDSSIPWPSSFRQHHHHTEKHQQLPTSSLSMSNDTVIGSSPSNMFYFTQVHTFNPFRHINEPALIIRMIDFGSSYFKVSISRTHASFSTLCTIRAPYDQVRYGKCLCVCVIMLITFTSQTPFCCCHRRLDRCKGRTTCDISAVSRRMAGVPSNDRTRSTCHAMV